MGVLLSQGAFKPNFSLLEMFFQEKSFHPLTPPPQNSGIAVRHITFTNPRDRRMMAAMRVVLAVFAMALVLVETGGIASRARTASAAPTASAASSAPKARVDFETQLKPMLQSKCMPCHFSGGKMYDRLPFDKPATIRKLGTRLFTRIHEEHDRKLIEDFLAQAP
jgi:hypothetical protein